jgi:hypothetical protein
MNMCKSKNYSFVQNLASHYMTASNQYDVQNIIRWPADCNFAEMSVRYFFHDTNQKNPSKFLLLFLLKQVPLEADLHHQLVPSSV